MRPAPQPIHRPSDSFTVVDANQAVASALVVIRRSPARWIVIFRRDSAGTFWYVYSKEEFVGPLRSSVSPTKHLKDLLLLHESANSHAVERRGDKVIPMHYTGSKPSGRAVLLDKRTQRVMAIGTAPISIPSMTFGASQENWGAVPAPIRRKTPSRPERKWTAKKSSGRPRGFHELVRRVSKVFDTVQVMFATDREMAIHKPGTSKFSNVRCADGTVNFGVCEVSIPRRHKIGGLESPSWFHLQFRCDPSKHITVIRTDVLSRPQFFAHVRQLVNASARKDALVFVHGYNVNFEDAVRRTAQIAYDLKFQGAPILYSWPSKARLLAYTADEATVEVSAARLGTFLRSIGRLSGADVIHVIAHSMGNRALLLALERLVEGGVPPQINNVILTAPDIDIERFYQIADAIRNYPTRTTLYASSNDKALRESQRRHRYPRAGESGDSIVIAPGIDTVDASLVDTNLFSLGHSYFSKRRTVLSDISDVLEGKLPQDRFQLFQQTCDRGRYWSFRQ